MSASKRAVVAGSMVLIALQAGCFYSTAPRRFLPDAEQSQRDAFGSWIRLEEPGERKTRVTEGELIAAHADTVFVMTESGLRAVAAAGVKKVTLTAYDSHMGDIAGWATLGTLATVSHGVVLILTAPTWIIAGSFATASVSKAPRVESKQPTELRKYARFPQGLPAELDRATLVAKCDLKVIRSQRVKVCEARTGER